MVFFGTSAFAVPSLRELSEHGDVLLVVTQPDRPTGRGHRLQPSPVKASALDLGIPTLEPERLRDALPRLTDERADLFAVASYGKIMPQAVLDLPRIGALNVHPSLLPLYRGATPLQSAIRDGRRESGVTIIVMDAGMDTGDIVLAERTLIGEGETYGELHDRCALLGARLLVRAVHESCSGRLKRMPQMDAGVPQGEIAATATHPLTKDDLVLQWSWPAQRIVDHVRSLSPQPLARAALRGETIKIAAAHVARPDEGDQLESVLCGDGAKVVLDTVIPPSRAPMSGVAYLRKRDSA